MFTKKTTIFYFSKHPPPDYSNPPKLTLLYQTISNPPIILIPPFIWYSRVCSQSQGMRYRGVQGGMAPSKLFSGCCSKSLFFYYFSTSEYQIGNPCSCVNLVQFLPFISLDSLRAFQNSLEYWVCAQAMV